MTIFAALERLASAAIDNLHGEMTRVDRRAKEQFFGAADDPSRPSVTAIGIIDINPVVVMNHQQRINDGMTPQLVGERIHVSYALSQFASPAEQPIDGDTIVAVTRPGEPQFKITRIDPDGIGRIVCVCVKA